MSKDKAASAGSKRAAKEPFVAKRMVRIPRGSIRYPAAICEGEAPAKGDPVTLKMENGQMYRGVVHDSTEADGEVLIEFRDGLKPVDKK